MYNKLLISAGGGIISRDQQAEQNEAATIAIGLGGTGVSCLRALKKEVYNRLKPDDSDALVPTYRHIKFLAVDTDRSSLSENGSVDSIDSNTEFLDLSCADIASLLAGAATLKNRPSLQWLKASATQPDGIGISILDANSRASGVPQIGRLCFFLHITQFLKKITNIINEIKQENLSQAKLNIHIFTGMCGCTGAGIFLDVCYVIKYILKSMGYSAHVSGYFFTPDVNLNKISHLYSAYADGLKTTGIASLAELDYCMNFETNGDEWNQEYEGFTIQTKEQPVDLAYIISTENGDSSIHNESYKKAMYVVSNYVMNFMVRETANKFKSSTTYLGHFYSTLKRTTGACYKYVILGSDSAYVPKTEITTYLASKIFEGFGRIDRQLPSKNEFDLFVKNTGLSYEEISRALNSNVPEVPMYDIDTKFEQMHDSITMISNAVIRNKCKMLENLESSNVDNISSIASMITRVKNKLMEISGQSDKGPYYASAILHNVNAVDLQNQIDGCIAYNSTRLSMARADLALRDQTMANTLHALQNSNILNRKKRSQEYVDSVNSYFKQCAKIDFLIVLGEVLIEFKNQIKELYHEYFAIFDTVMHNLEATFESNRTALSNPIVADNGYAVKLITIQDLQESLDASVKAMRIDDLISGFVNYMLSNPEIWIAQDENKIAHAVSTFFLAELNEFTGRTMLDYLKIKYQTDDPQIIADKVYNDIVMPMYDRAKPLFWLDGSKYTIPASSELGFCTIPQISDVIENASQKFKACHKNITLCLANNFECSISFTRIYLGLPLFAYKGITQYSSCKYNYAGQYIYEGAIGDTRDWRKLCNLVPFSIFNNYLTCENNIMERRKDIIEKAKVLGIYTKNNFGEPIVNVFDENALRETIKNSLSKQEDLCRKTNVNFPIIDQIRIYTKVANDNNDIIADDIVIGSLWLFEIVSKQVELLERLYKSN